MQDDHGSTGFVGFDGAQGFPRAAGAAAFKSASTGADYGASAGARESASAAEADADHLRLTRALFPDLADRIDQAYTRNVTARGGSGHGQSHLDDWLDDEATKLRDSVLAGVAFADLENSDVRHRFEASFRAARQIAGWISIELPEPESFSAGGVDLRLLAAASAEDEQLQLVPTLFGLGVTGWRELFRRAAALPESPLGPRGVPGAADDSAGLVLASEVVRGFSLLDRPSGVERARVRSSSDPDVEWTLRLVPAADSPSVMGLSYRHGSHVTLPEMLMLQLIRLVQGESLVDRNSFTWLDGLLGEGRLAARHVFDEGEAAVRVSCREIGNQGPHLGSRSPVGSVAT